MIDWLESPLTTNALLLAMLLWMIFHGRIQRMSHRMKRAARRLVARIRNATRR